MAALVWIGAGLSLLGLAGVIRSIFTVLRARRRQLSDEELREVMRRALPWNLGALFVSVIGLMTVSVGLALG
jgi:heme exporter protein D